jgi:hypothetical protein
LRSTSPASSSGGCATSPEATTTQPPGDEVPCATAPAC